MLNPKHTNLIPWINCRKLHITVFLSSAKRMRRISLFFHRKAWIFLAKLRNYAIWKQEDLLAPRGKLLTSCHPDSSFLSLSPLPNPRRSCICKQWDKAGLLCASYFPTPRMCQRHFVCRMRWDKEFLFAVSDDAVSCQDCIAPEEIEWIWNTSWTGPGGGGGSQKRPERNMSHYFFLQDKSHIDWPRPVSGYLKRDAGDWPPEIWRKVKRDHE